jgi:hypothetical protein
MITISSSNPTDYLERRKNAFLENGFFSSSRRRKLLVTFERPNPFLKVFFIEQESTKAC